MVLPVLDMVVHYTCQLNVVCFPGSVFFISKGVGPAVEPGDFTVRVFLAV